MKKIITLLLMLSPLLSYSQTIKLHLPKEANKQFVITGKKGIETITLYTGKFSFTGDVTIKLPEDEKFVGMVKLDIEKGEKPNIIINDEDFSMSVDEKGNHIFKNSKENSYLYSLMEQKTKPLEADSTLYAQRFIKTLQCMTAMEKVLYSNSSLMELSNVRSFALHQLDMDFAYTTGLWANIVDSFIRLAKTEEKKAEDIIQLLKRTKSDEAFIHFTENVITITQQYGWNETFDQVITYVKESNRIPVPTGDIYDAFIAIQVQVGKPAPAIEGLKSSNKNEKKTLIVFYQTSCNICKEQMQKLIANHKEIEDKGVRIVSISSDHKKEEFSEDIKTFPWADKLCDFKGFAGSNFINWGIMATPSFFLIDENNIVVGKYAMLDNISFE